jgi:hypothetical protein
MMSIDSSAVRGNNKSKSSGYSSILVGNAEGHEGVAMFDFLVRFQSIYHLSSTWRNCLRNKGIVLSNIGIQLFPYWQHWISWLRVRAEERRESNQGADMFSNVVIRESCG